MSRRRGRGNAKARLQKQKKIQRALETELELLNSADVVESARQIKLYVETRGQDPMVSEENPFWNAPNYNYFGNKEYKPKIKALTAAYYYKMKRNWDADYDYSKTLQTVALLSLKQLVRIISHDEKTKEDHEIINSEEMKEIQNFYYNFPMDKTFKETEFMKLQKFSRICRLIYTMCTYEEIIFYEINNFYMYRIREDINKETELPQICSIVYVEFYSKLANSLKAIVQENSEELEKHQHIAIFKELQKRNGLTNDQLQLLHDIVDKHIHYHPLSDSFSLSFKTFNTNKWNAENNQRKIWEIYSVHESFRNQNNPIITYNVFSFWKEYLELHPQNNDFQQYIIY
eukprot:134776_1